MFPRKFDRILFRFTLAQQQLLDLIEKNKKQKERHEQRAKRAQDRAQFLHEESERAARVHAKINDLIA